MPKLARLLIVGVVLMIVPFALFAQNGDTLNIGGQVPLVLTLTLTPDTNADNLTLITAGVDTGVTVAIADIDISTNNTAGWDLYVFSTNSDATDTGMINADGDEIVYDVTYSGANGVANVDVTDSGLLVGFDATNAAQTGETLSITYTQSATHAAGYYSDQLTVVLRAR